MEFEYKKKDIKKSPKMKKAPEEGVVFSDGNLFKFIWKGKEHGFGSEENAKLALERIKGE